ncbi:hypothetical protein QQG55_52035 [Brugia pahangi]
MAKNSISLLSIIMLLIAAGFQSTTAHYGRKISNMEKLNSTASNLLDSFPLSSNQSISNSSDPFALPFSELNSSINTELFQELSKMNFTITTIPSF